MESKDRIVKLLKALLHGEDEDWWAKNGPDIYRESREILEELEGDEGKK